MWPRSSRQWRRPQRVRRLRQQDGPADIEHLVAASERQREWRLHRRVDCDGTERRRYDAQVTVGPDHSGTARAKIIEIDPRRARRSAVDQYAQLFGCVMRNIAAVPHAADDV